MMCLTKGRVRDSDTDQRELFHRVVAKNAFISKRGRQDVQLIAAVLCTRAQKPSEKDWSRLIWHMKWPHRTKDDAMAFDKSKGISAFECCIDANFVVHQDFWSHTGGSGRFAGGLGCLINVSAN